MPALQPTDPPAPPRFGSGASRGRYALLAVWGVSLAYALAYLDRGWIPHDEGLLAQTAERVLLGELPHRDFDDPYTGGLAFLHALAFRLFGHDLMVLRGVLLAAFAVWVPAVFHLASRFVGPMAAGAVTLLAVTWSIPNYSAAMPSWYNLFLATFATVGLFRHVETGRSRWLVLAGAAAGLSILIKVVGLYFVAAALLFLVFREQELSRGGLSAEPDATKGSRSPVYATFTLVALVTFAAVLSALVLRVPNVRAFVYFALPGMALVGLLAARVRHRDRGTDARRFAQLAGMAGPFLLGAAIPVGGFVLAYAGAGALGDLYRGVFVLPAVRLTEVAWIPLRVRAVLEVLGLALVAGCLARLPRGTARVLLAGMLLLAAAALLYSHRDAVYRGLWSLHPALMPASVFVGVLLLIRGGRASAMARLPAQELFLLLAATALGSLVQFPFAAPVYFFFIAPCVALTGAAIAAASPPASRAVAAVGLVLLLGFGVLRLNTGFIYGLDSRFQPHDQTEAIDLPRAGRLKVSPSDKVEYEALAATLWEVARGDYIWAGPDSPEVYFLGRFRNPTRTFFDVLERDERPPDELLAQLDSHSVNAVVLNTDPHHSRTPSRELFEALAQRYREGARIGRFVVLWDGATPPP